MTKTLVASLLGMIAIAAGSLVVPNSGNAQDFKGRALGEPVLVELFTSQGCSSCPPADRLAARLSRDPDLVVISRPVTYWDRLGWKDTFARSENTDLQRAYARRGLAGYNGVYTPQSVVDGKLGEVGSDERSIRNFVETAKTSQNAALRIRGDRSRGVAVGIAGDGGGAAELVLFAVSTHNEVAIGRGENRGRTIGYTNVLLDERPVGRWTGGKASQVIAPGEFNVSGADRYALVLREPNAGPVIAARWIS